MAVDELRLTVPIFGARWTLRDVDSYSCLQLFRACPPQPRHTIVTVAVWLEYAALVGMPFVETVGLACRAQRDATLRNP